MRFQADPRSSLTAAQQETIDDARVKYGLPIEDVVVLSSDRLAEVVMGTGKGRPKRLLVDPAGVVVLHELL